MRAGAVVLVVLAVLATAAARDDSLAALERLLPAALLDTAPAVLRALSAACDLLPLEIMWSGGRSGGGEEMSRMRVVEMSRGGAAVELGVGGAARRVARDAAGPLVVYVPGWNNTPHDEAARALVGALHEHHRAVLVLDTCAAFCRGYPAAAARVAAAAGALAALLEGLAREGVPPAAVHLVGFSLGAHVAGLAARRVRRHLRARVGRITALDPARPCFGRGRARLSAGDASFVQVVHSSAGLLGLEEPLGHADVYLTPAAECAARALPFECDHNHSWRVYAASAARPAGGMPARRCRDARELAAAACSGETALLGYHCTNRTRGIFLYNS